MGTQRVPNGFSCSTENRCCMFSRERSHLLSFGRVLCASVSPNLWERQKTLRSSYLVSLLLMYTTQKQGWTMAVLDCWTVSVHPLRRITMKSAKYCNEKQTICLIVIIFIIDPKGLGSSNKIDSLRNKKKFLDSLSGSWSFCGSIISP